MALALEKVMINAKALLLSGVALVTSVLTGCTTVPVDVGPGSILGEGGLRATHTLQARAMQTKVAATTTDKAVALSTDFRDTLAACNKVFTGFERQANTFRWTSFAIAMAGTIAGAVVVPALTAAGAEAHRVTIAAMGGLAGAANSAQGLLNDQGLSAAETIKARVTPGASRHSLACAVVEPSIRVVAATNQAGNTGIHC